MSVYFVLASMAHDFICSVATGDVTGHTHGDASLIKEIPLRKFRRVGHFLMVLAARYLYTPHLYARLPGTVKFRRCMSGETGLVAWWIHGTNRRYRGANVHFRYVEPRKARQGGGRNTKRFSTRCLRLEPWRRFAGG